MSKKRLSIAYRLFILLIATGAIVAAPASRAQSFYGSFGFYGNAVEAQYNLGLNGPQIQTTGNPGLPGYSFGISYDPSGIAQDSSGNVFVANYGGDGGNGIAGSGSLGSGSSGYSSSDGYSGILEYAGSDLTALPAILKPVAATYDSFVTEGVAVNSSSGSIFAVQNPYGYSTMSTYSGASNVVISYANAAATPDVIAEVPSSGNGIGSDNMRIAINQATGNLFVADCANSTVYEFNEVGTPLNSYAVPNLTPQIAADSLGNVYVTESDNSVEKINSGTGAITTVMAPSLDRDISLSVNQNNDLYVNYQGLGPGYAYYLDKMEEYSSGGTDLGQVFYSTSSPIAGQPPSDVLVVNGAPVAPAVTPSSNSATITTNASYATVPSVSANGGLGTTAVLVGGENFTGFNQTVTLTSVAGGNFKNLASDTFTVSGNDGSAFALQLSFNLTNATLLGGAANMVLLWQNPANGLWENAVEGDHRANTTNPLYLDYSGSFASLESAYGVSGANLGNFLGAYGVDTNGDTVWAVIDHNSTFSGGNFALLPVAVPEPSTYALLGLGVLALLIAARRKIA